MLLCKKGYAIEDCNLCYYVCLHHYFHYFLMLQFARTPLDCVNDPVVRKELSEAYVSFE